MGRAKTIFTAIAAVAALASATAAAAETWTKYADGDNGTEWSYDGDYSYRDKATGRLVVMKAISKPSVNIAPGGPDKGVGFVEAIDCKNKNVLRMGAYKPSTGLTMEEKWRSSTPKPADASLAAAVCPHLEHVPVK